MAGNLEISFNSPQCGWMSIGFDDGVSEFHTTTAHAPHAFALAELMQILTDLLDPSSEINEYVLRWNRDPEEYDFRFLRNGNMLTLEIYQYPSAERDLSDREIVYKHSGDIHEICRAFEVTFDQLYADRETDEFEFNWRQPFPHSEFQRFKESAARG